MPELNADPRFPGRRFVYGGDMRGVGLAGALGGAVGLAAAGLQWWSVPAGSIPAAGLPWLLVVFAVAGFALGVAGGAPGRLLSGHALAVPVLGLLVSTCGLGFAAVANRRGPPDVYLLVSDTTRADHLSVYGYERPTTPSLEAFAERAVCFTNAVSQGSHTLVTMSSLLSSRYPSEHGMRRYADRLPDDLPLLAEHLKRAGYRTYGYATNPHLAPAKGFSRGFDAFGYSGRWHEATAATVNRNFLRWLDEADGHEAPRFALLFYIDPHSPYAPPDEYARRFARDQDGPPVTRWPRGERPPAEGSARLQNLIAQYDGAIAYFDAAFGALIDALERRGALEDALIVYTSDHGEEFFEHGRYGHDKTLFEESIRVPLLISAPPPLRFPPLPRPTGRVDAVVSSVDLLPTILDAAGAPPDPGARGRSLMPLVRGASAGDDEGISYHEEILDTYGHYDLRAVRSRDHKYIRVLRDGGEGEGGGRDLFFDLRADPAEQRDLSETESPERSRHRRALERMLDEMSRIDPPDNESVRLHPERIAELRELGYLGSELGDAPADVVGEQPEGMRPDPR